MPKHAAGHGRMAERCLEDHMVHRWIRVMAAGLQDWPAAENCHMASRVAFDDGCLQRQPICQPLRQAVLIDFFQHGYVGLDCLEHFGDEGLATYAAVKDVVGEYRASANRSPVIPAKAGNHLRFRITSTLATCCSRVGR